MSKTTGIHRVVGADIEGLGGLLQCSTCDRQVEFYSGAHADYLAGGWPKCHGYTMTWWTQRQIDAGEAPAFTPWPLT